MNKSNHPTKPTANYVANTLNEMLVADHGILLSELEKITKAAESVCPYFDAYVDLALTIDNDFERFDQDFDALNSSGCKLEKAITESLVDEDLSIIARQLVYTIWISLLFQQLNEVHPISIFSAITSNITSRLAASHQNLFRSH